MKDINVFLAVMISLLLAVSDGRAATASAEATWLATSQDPPAVIHESNPPEPVAFAAAELRRYLREILGTNVPDAPKGADSPVIRLAIQADPALTDEGYELHVEGRTFRITGGGPAGVVFGSYEFLRRYGGCRFSDLAPDGEYVPRKDRIEAAAAPLRRTPKLWYRAIQQYCYEDADLSRRRIDWMAKNGMNYLTYSPAPELTDWKTLVSVDPQTGHVQVPTEMPRFSKEWFDRELRPAIRRRGMKLDMNHHNLLYWLPPGRYLQKHAEWYAQMGGQRGKEFKQLCICTSNQEAVRTLIDNVRKYLRENAEVKLAGVIVEDGIGMCQCEQCLAQDENRQDAFRTDHKENRSKSRRYAKLLNAVAQAIRGEFPDVLVGGAAYVDLLWPPRDVKLEPNMAVWVALYWRDGSRPIAPEGTSAVNIRFFDALQQWKAVYPGRLTVYEYYMGMNAQLSLPYPQWEVICEDWKHLKTLGVGGATVQCWASCHSVYAPNLLAFARCGWDDQVDPARVMDDYLRGTYNSVAEQVRPIFAGLNQAVGEWAKTKGDLLPNGRSVTSLLDRVGKETLHRALVAAREKASDARERRQVERLAAAARYWELSADAFTIQNQVARLEATDPAGALALVERLHDQKWPELEKCLQSLPPGWQCGPGQYGKWRSFGENIKRTEERLRARLRQNH